MMDIIEFEDIKIEPYYLEPLEPVIVEKSEVPNRNDKPMILLSTTGEQRTFMELEIKIESCDLGVWEDKPIDFNGRETSSTVPGKSVDQQEMQHGKGKICATYANIPNHSMIPTQGELYKLHKCSVCEKTFKRKDHMKRHVMIHTAEKPHECNVCGKAFTLKSGLRRHRLIHTGEKLHECDVCGKAFTRKSGINRHMMIHTGDKPHECNVCRKAFIRKSHMKRHMTIHTGEKRHECSVCGKTFTRNSVMKRHMMIHTGEKPHECDVCGKAFTRKSDKIHHIIAHI